jgi:uroporphyrinogen-III synthase
MRVVVTRPQADADRTASALRGRGHEVLVAPLMRVEPITADISGQWGAIVITSANAPVVLAGNPARAVLIKLPLFAVGHRSADAARVAGFADVTSAGGDVRDLVQLIVERHADAKAPLLYLAGEDRATDLIGELSVHGIAAEMRVVYRAVTASFPDELIEALKAGEIDAVLHFSRRSAENYLSGANRAGIPGEALKPRHICLSEPIAAPLVAAGATAIAIARHPQEADLIELLVPPRG